MANWPLALGAFVAGNYTYHAVTWSIANDANAPVVPPPAKTSIVIACWREKMSVMTASLDSIKNQNVVLAYPEAFEIVIIGCEGVDKSLLQEYAQKVDCVSGKLSARNRGMQLATGDIIVSVDCDAWVPPNWLNMVLQQFQDPKIVAVETTSINGHNPLYFALSIMFRGVLDLPALPRLMGRGSAFRRSVWDKVGPFRTNFDQRNALAMVQVEEIEFAQNVGKYGQIQFLPLPVVHLEDYSGGRGIRS